MRDFPLEILREFIDWTPFFHAWELKGVYPRILDHPEQGIQARLLFKEANALLDRMIAEKLITARGVYGLFPANAVGDDVEFIRGRDARIRARAVPLFTTAVERRGRRAMPFA